MPPHPAAPDGSASYDTHSPPLGGSNVVLPLHMFGLANRLRSLASIAIIAEDAGSVVTVDWQPSEDCNATLGDLFDTQAAAAGLLFDGYDRDTHFPLAMRINPATGGAGVLTSEHQVVVPLMGARGDTLPVLHALRANPGVQFVFLSTGLFRPQHVDCQVVAGGARVDRVCKLEGLANPHTQLKPGGFPKP